MATAPATPGSPNRRVVERPRLLARLAKRMQARLTLVVGGAGAGKSTLLAQAMAVAEPDLDVWYGCRPADRDPVVFLAGLLDASAATLAHGGPGHPADAVTAIGDLVLGAAPHQVCLVVDDTHVLDGAVEVLERLLEELPRNGHLLLAGRRRPELPTARRDAAGRLHEIGQADLLFTDAEVAAFAQLRNVDVDRLAAADGWPAFVELACQDAGSRSRRYLREEAIERLDPERRSALARFALVGGGDDEIALAVTGRTVDELTAEVPLVRIVDGQAKLHDLWVELLTDELADDDRAEAATAASAILGTRGELDRAVELALVARDPESLVTAIETAVLGGVDGGLRADQLSRWRSVLPAGERARGICSLVDGIIERERNPTSAVAASHFDAAARAFATAGQHELELAALAQLGYLIRVSGDPGGISEVRERIEQLAEHHAPAAPFLAFCDAWIALVEFDPARQLAAVDAIRNDDVPPVWTATRDHLRGHAHLTLGRPDVGLELVPVDIASLAVSIPGALATRSQCRWMAGQPHEALADPPAGLSDRHGGRDRSIAGSWIGFMRAHSGDTAGARDALAAAQEALGDEPDAQNAGQAAAVALVIDVVEGHEAKAAEGFAGLLELMPLETTWSSHVLRNHLVYPFVLLPATREFWRSHDLGPFQTRSLRLAEAFVTAREDDDLTSLARIELPESGLIAAWFPVPWAVELGIDLVRAGRHEGRSLVAWLCEHWGEPARTGLFGWLADERRGPAATDLLSSTPLPPGHAVTLSVIGSTQLEIDGEPSANPDWRRERVRALLVQLVLQRETTRDRLAGGLWPDLASDRAQKNLRTTLNYVHGVLEPRRGARDAPWFVRVEGQRIRLHHELDVDLWRFTDLLDRAEHAERSGRPTEALPLLQEGLARWRGDLAADLDLEWLDLDRIHLRSRYVRAACRAAELLVASGRGDEAVDAVRPALAVDPWCERAYRALADAYLVVGDPTSARAVEEEAAKRRAGLGGDG